MLPHPQPPCPLWSHDAVLDQSRRLSTGFEPGMDLSKEFGTLMKVSKHKEHGDTKIAHSMELGSMMQTIQPSNMTTLHMKKNAKTWKDKAWEGKDKAWEGKDSKAWKGKSWEDSSHSLFKKVSHGHGQSTAKTGGGEERKVVPQIDPSVPQPVVNHGGVPY